ncbi:ferredoxin-2 [bacterium BMS3Abin07]|nr:ferredoxin-2 [bacterium BMS3Abin07]GBE32676.1 ferredoxin-2 [bacterium BMS3Bbin05]HDZ87447.1 4Fe-4S dicluster domain-containing protein [Nitrospirota bacterium]
MYNVAVDDVKCEGCEECVNICPQEVFQMSDGKSDPANLSECVFCESCVGVCPSEAISITEI